MALRRSIEPLPKRKLIELDVSARSEAAPAPARSPLNSSFYKKAAASAKETEEFLQEELEVLREVRHTHATAARDQTWQEAESLRERVAALEAENQTLSQAAAPHIMDTADPVCVHVGLMASE